MFTAKEFMTQYYKTYSSATLIPTELINVVKEIAPILVAERQGTEERLRCHMDKIIAFQLAEEASLIYILLTMLELLKEKDQFFVKLEEEMKNVSHS